MTDAFGMPARRVFLLLLTWKLDIRHWIFNICPAGGRNHWLSVMAAQMQLGTCGGGGRHGFHVVLKKCPMSKEEMALLNA